VSKQNIFTIHGLSKFQATPFIIGFYSFGSFGLTNYFGARYFFELIALLLLTIIFILGFATRKARLSEILVITALLIIYSTGMTLMVSNTFVATALGILFFGVMLFFIEDKALIKIIFYIIIGTYILCIFSLISYLLYLGNFYSHHDSTASQFASDTIFNAVYPANFPDLLSMVSDGNSILFPDVKFRMRGYATEPSNTILHYLAPLSLSFIIFGARHIKITTVAILINFICIASFLGQLIIISSIPIYFIFNLRYKYKIICISIIFSLIFIISTNLDFLNLVMLEFLGIFSENASVLVANKMESSEIRTAAIGVFFENLMRHPFGGLDSGLTGLLSSFGGGGGLICALLYVTCIFYFLKKILNKTHKAQASEKYGLALLTSLILYTSIVSGYGFISIPGIIFFVGSFRLISIQTPAEISD
jgi:hypothetical protein